MTPRPTTLKPMTAPPEKAICRASLRLLRAAAAVRTLAAVATRMPNSQGRADRAGEQRDADQGRALGAAGVGPGEQDRYRQDEHGQDAVLTTQERHGALADVVGNLRHLVGAGVLAANPGTADKGEQESEGAADGHRVQEFLFHLSTSSLGVVNR